MFNQLKFVVFFDGVLFILALVVNIGCSIHILPASRVTVENRLGQPVIIYGRLVLDGSLGTLVNWGQADPGNQLMVFGMGPPTSEKKIYQIEAKTLDGQIVWRRDYTREQIEARGYLLVIDGYDKPGGPTP